MSTHPSTSQTKVKVGSLAPDFTLTSQSGEQVSLKDYIGKKVIVLYFYPKDDTPGCTKEACSFRDSYETFKEAGAEVIGISTDTVASHQQFSKKYQLPFILVSDPDGAVRKRYNVPSTFGIIPGRVTYVIDKVGVIRNIFSSQFTPEKHIVEAINTLKAL